MLTRSQSLSRFFGIIFAIIAAFLVICTAAVEIARGQGLALPFVPYPDNPRLLLKRNQIFESDMFLQKPLPADAAKIYQRAHLLDPLDPLPFVAAARMAHDAGQPNRAIALLEAAMRIDPRSYLTRYQLMREYLEAGRIEAGIGLIVKTANFRADQDQIFLPALAAAQILPHGRLMLLKTLRPFPAVRDRLILFASQTDGLEGLLAFLLKNAGTDPVTLRNVIETVSRRGKYAMAYSMWRNFAPAAANRGYPFDQALIGIAAPAPFGWQLITDAEVNAQFPREGKAGLQAQFFGASETNIMQQVMLAPPGRYRFIVTGIAGSGAAGKFEWNINCIDGSNLPATIDFEAEKPGSATHAVDFEILSGCTAQRIVLSAKPADNGADFEMRFTHVIIQPITPQ